ncbi:MAG: RNA polymerase sigma factor region1.1 domain-containing protein, partial [Syntrophorhabdaceae bacterium]
MALNNFSKVKGLIDMGTQSGFSGSDEITDFVSREITPPEEIEDVFDLLSEPNIDIVEMMQEKARPRKEESADGREVESLPSETADNAVWAYLRDMARMPLLTSDEEFQIVKKIEEADRETRNILFGLPQALVELFEIGRQLKEETVGIADVINGIDEINCTKEVEDAYIKKTISSINTIKRLHEKKEVMQNRIPGMDETGAKELAHNLRKIEEKKEEILFSLKLSKKVLTEIVKKIARHMNLMNAEEAHIIQRKLKELADIVDGLKVG